MCAIKSKIIQVLIIGVLTNCLSVPLKSAALAAPATSYEVAPETNLSKKEAPLSAAVEKHEEDPSLVMEQFTKVFAPPQIVPNGKGVKPEELSELKTVTQRGNILIKKFKDALGKAGSSTKPPVATFSCIRSPVSYAACELYAVLTRLANAYAVAKPAEAEAIKAMTCDFCRQILELEAGENDMRTLWSMAIILMPLNGKQTIFAMRKELEEAELLEPLANTLLWWGSPNCFFTKNPPQPLDANEYGRVWAYIDQVDQCAIIATLRNSPKKYSRIKSMQSYLSRLIEGGGIARTGEMIYHGGFHMAYAYGMPPKIAIVSNMNKAGLPVSPEAQSRLRAYGRMNAFISMDTKISPNLMMRAGSPGSGRYFDVAQLADSLGTQDQPDEELAGLFLASAAQFPPPRSKDEWRKERDLNQAAPIVERYQKAGIKPSLVEGCFTLPARPGLVWRSNDWMLSVAGMRPDFIGIEMYGWVTPPANAFVCNGSVLAMRKGHPDEYAVGYVPEKGWNWSLWPATTSLVKTDAESTGSKSVILITNHSPIGGVLSVGQGKDAAGLLAYRHEAGDFQDDTLNFNKSIFLFNGRALVLTSGISSQAPFPCVTTLYQEHLETPPQILGEIQATSSLSAPSGLGYTLLTSPHSAPESKPMLRAFNRHQTWRTPNPANVKQGVQYPTLFYILGFNQKPPWKDLPKPSPEALKVSMDKMLDDFIPGEGDFAVAYLDHGVKPVSAACAFLMSVNGVPDQGSVQLKRLDADAHCAYDEIAKAWIYSSFKPDTAWADCGLLKHVGRAAALIAKESGDGHLNLSLASWDEKNTEAYSVTLQGRWSALSGSATVKTDADKTVITVPYDGDQACHVVLEKMR
ncbi:MAG: polysaccharide lyase family 8 super-sandwich domain-containing protein [Victivallales bacterium]|jgi:hypothetical protein